MKLAVLLQTIKWIGTRVGFAFLVFFLLFQTLANHARLKVKALNQLRPTYIYLQEFINGKTDNDPEQFAEYIHYFKQVVKFMPNNADAHAVLGYCYFYYGQVEKAIKRFERAIEINPYHFWYYYDLGLIHVKEERFDQAIEYLNKALAQLPERTLYALLNSKVYRPMYVWEADENFGMIKANLDQGARDAISVLILLYLRMQDYTKSSGLALYAIQKELDRDGRFYYYAGFIAYQQGEFREAAGYLHRAITKNPERAEAIALLAETLRHLNEKKKADWLLKKAAYLRQRGYEELKSLSGFQLKLF